MAEIIITSVAVIVRKIPCTYASYLFSGNDVDVAYANYITVCDRTITLTILSLLSGMNST